MSKLFKIGGKIYARKQYTCTEIAKTILPSLYGTSIKDVNYEQLVFIKNVMNDGWRLIPGFYGEKTDKGTLLRPNLSWFSFVGTILNDNGDYECHHWYTMCVNYSKYEITLYDSEHAIGTFPSYFDMLECTGHNRFNEMIPSKFVGYDLDTSNLSYFDFDDSTFDDEIYRKDNLVYESLDNNKLNVHIDGNSLIEPVTEPIGMSLKAINKTIE